MAQNKKRRTYRQEQAAKARQAKALVALCLALTIGLIWGAYEADRARGITVTESLEQWGI